MKKLILGAALPAVAVAACTGAAHLPQLQPPATNSAQAATPVPATIRAAGAAQSARFQRGVGIDFYTYPGQDIRTAATATIAYASKLHANAVMISFPFFMKGPRARGVEATSATPAPAQIAVVVRTAQQAGMRVSLRPLLDEHNLGEARPLWKPAYPAAWFRSYQRFLRPYAVMARRQHVSAFYAGAEFTQFESSPRWYTLDAALRRVYHGQLLYANNWRVRPGHPGGKVTPTVDAYRPIKLPPSATVAQLAAKWRIEDKSFPAGIAISEAGIAAARGAYHKPWIWHWNVSHISTRIQARWFAAACRAAVATHLKGIYFWSINMSADQHNPPTLANQTAWNDSPGATAIANCYAWIKRTGK